MKGSSIGHVSGGDRPGPIHVPYAEPKPKQTGLDWSTMRPRFDGDRAVAPDRCLICTRPADSPDRRRCQEHYDLERANDPHRQHQEVPMLTLTAPDRDDVEVTSYVADMARVLTRTEAHPDKLVRDLRKLAVQAIQALATATAPTSVPAPASRAATPTPPGVASSPRTGAGTSPSPSKNGAQAASRRIVDLGSTPATVRHWAAQNGIECTARGPIPTSVIDAFEASIEVRA